jgi:Protein-L-isoaspartate(D-aspartate) O-methyltransferase (PCMT)
LFDQVPRAAFIPDTIWVDDPEGPGFITVSRHEDPARWEAAVAANGPVIIQINFGDPHAEGGQNFRPARRASRASSRTCSTPSTPSPGTRCWRSAPAPGWNAALLAHRVGPAGRITTIEIDPQIADDARRALHAAGYPLDVVTGDGVVGYPAAAPYERVMATASVREVVPRAWLEQLRPGGRLVTPWGTDYGNGALLTLELDQSSIATGRFSGNLTFMRLRRHQGSLFGWEPDEDTIAAAEVSTTDCRGKDLDMMLNPTKGKFAIGVRLPDVALVVEWDKHGSGCHVIELDDLTTHSFARLEADLGDPAPFTVAQLGPRRLWDEAVDAYDWWYDHGRPGPERLGLTITPDSQVVWLDNPATIVRTWNL